MIQRQKKENPQKYEALLKELLPQAGTDMGKIVLAQVMLALKMEGLVGKDLSEKDAQMINFIKEKMLKSPEARQKAIQVAEELLKEGKNE